MTTLDYYNENAEAFVQGTVNVDFTETQKRFLEYLSHPSNATTSTEHISQDNQEPSKNAPSTTSASGPLILDLGCGSGRDSKFFLSQGYRVEAVDGSPELCRLAEQVIGQPVKCMLFQDLSAIEKYDGLWACASLLHLPLDELQPVLKKCALALKPDGIMYLSFKYGTGSGQRNGRWFTDMTLEGLTQLLATNTPKLEIQEQWLSNDARPERQAEQWVNAIVRRKE